MAKANWNNSFFKGKNKSIYKIKILNKHNVLDLVDCIKKLFDYNSK